MKLGFSPTQGDQHYEEMVEEVEYAEANGLDSVFLQEHHEAEVDQYWSDPLTVLAAIASVTDEIDLGTAILLLPLYDPVRLAERGAILDGLSNGRFVLGAAVGYRPREFELYETDRSRRGTMYEEYLTLVSRLWSEERVTFDGEFSSVDEFRCTPRPVSAPRPRIWVGGYHDVVLDRTARLLSEGLVDCWFPGTQSDRGGLVVRRNTFDGMLEDRGLDPDEVDQPLFRDGIIAETTEEAIDLANEYVGSGYEKQYRDRGHEASKCGDLGHDVIHEDYDPQDLVEDRFIVGDPDDWIEEVRSYGAEFGADHIVTRIYFEGMSHEAVMDQLELLCSEVAPEV